MLIFVSLGKMRKKTDKAMAGNATEMIEDFKKKGINILNWYLDFGAL
jgi:hypothetical protein